LLKTTEIRTFASDKQHEDMETTRISHSPIAPYWGMVKGLSDNMKLELVTLLIDSVRTHPVSTAIEEQERERGFRNLAGCWVDDHDDDIETIIREGRAARNANRTIPPFDE